MSWPITAAVALLLSLLLAAAAAFVWLRGRKRFRGTPRKRRAPIPRHPVVFAHGLFGFDKVEFAGKQIEYFRDVPGALSALGAEVHVPRVAPVADVATRAAQLAEQIGRIPARRVNVIAHSMGGVDARYAISRLGLAHKVASLTTIGTPHRGTPLADLGSAVTKGRYGIARVLNGFGLPLEGIEDAMPKKMKRFNRRIEDAPGVHYGCVLAKPSGGVKTVSTMLVPSWLFLAAGGDNDGIVHTSSQEWGEVLEEIDADHWAQVGWSRRFDAPAFYARLLAELRGRGL